MCEAALGAVNVIATYFAFRWIDKFGRRPLAMGGYLGMAVFMVIAAAAVAFLTDIPKTVVVMVGFSFFITRECPVDPQRYGRPPGVPAAARTSWYSARRPGSQERWSSPTSKP